MKAAVLYAYGQTPKYADFNDPVPQNEKQIVMTVKAASIKNLDKGRASGRHYSSHAELPTVVGIDGAGILEDGTRVYAIGITGMMADKALISAHNYVQLPANVSFEIAAALPNAMLGTDAALLYRGNIQKGDTILINGATGVTGQTAIQVAKYRGAAKVIVTGRNEGTFATLKSLGADEIIPLKQTDEAIVNQLKEIQKDTPIDIVMDYLWGHPVELIITAIKGSAPRKIKVISIGSIAGASISLESETLRSTKIEFIGSGLRSISSEEWGAYMKNTLPEMFSLAAEGKLKADIETYNLKDIELAWTIKAEGKRVVIVM